ncbi:helix-turn-helix domain-containing protein [Arthrobacter sp. H41]|uniref:helix-turn-helix domain-containing protein n=1 Tax=Arthrobacter sp. H41 TaxID=1312978 RepID=UPI0004B97B60
MVEMPDTELPRDLLTVAEVAEVMRVSKMTVYRLVQSGTLEGIRFGRSYRVSESAVQQYLSAFNPQYGAGRKAG